MKNYSKILTVAVVLVLSFIFASQAVAQTNLTQKVFTKSAITSYTPLAPLDGETSIPVDSGSFGNYINLMYKIVLGVSGALAVVMITVGGIEYMGSEGPFSKESGKKKIEGAVIGLLLLISCYLILNTINPKLLDLNLEITPANNTLVNGINDSWITSSETTANGDRVTKLKDPENGNIIIYRVDKNGTISVKTTTSASGQLLEEETFYVKANYDIKAGTIITKDYSQDGKIVTTIKDNATNEVVSQNTQTTGSIWKIVDDETYSKQVNLIFDSTGTVIGSQTVDTLTKEIIASEIKNSDGTITKTEKTMNGDTIKTTTNCSTKKAVQVVTTPEGKSSTINLDVYSGCN